MRILHVTFMYPTQERPVHGVAVKAIVHGLKAADPHTEQLVLHISNDLPEVPEGIKEDRIVYYRIKMPSYYKLFHFYSDTKIKTIFAKYAFDIVHFHNLFPGVFLLKNFIATEKLPYILTFRGSCPRAIRFSYRNNALEKMISEASAYIFLSEYFADETQKELLKKGIVLKEEKINFIPNFKENHWLDNVKKTGISKPVKILLLANIEERKNLEITLQAIRYLQKEYYLECNLYGYIYDKKVFENIKIYFDENIKYHSPLANEELKTIIDQHHILVLCAHQETFGISYIESILRERPVVYARNAGIDTFIKNKNYGIAVEDVNNTVEIKKAIVKVIENYENFDFSGKEIFIESNVIPRLVSLYKKAIGK